MAVKEIQLDVDVQPRPSGLAAALAAFQAELPRIGKSNTADTGTYKYKYADLADVSAEVLPRLGKYGLSFSSRPTLDEQGRFVLRYVLRHESGESDGGDYPLPSGANPQQIGSAITYARRYTLCSVTGVAPENEDDDGERAKETRVETGPRWDAAEQEVMFTAWSEEIGKAKSAEEIASIGKSLLNGKRNGELSPNTYQKLAILGGRRKAELETTT